MSRPLRAVVDPEALASNLRRVREAAPGRRVMAVVKADGYGHGLVRVARALRDADGFGVASLEEGLVLRAEGVRRPVVLLEGFFSADELEPIARHALEVVVHQPYQVELLERVRLATPVRVWLKLDTGMHRLGFPPGEARALARRLEAAPSVRGPLRFMTHLARADERADAATPHQLERLRQGLHGLTGEVSVANSAGLLAWPEARADWVRPGIMLYGLSPFPDRTGRDDGLRAAMTLESRLIAVNGCPRGEAVGYGGAWVCPEDMPVGVAAVGYGDGYPRHAPPGTPVLLNGKPVPLVGRVSMDMVTLDLRRQPDARPGDPVVLWGPDLPAEEIARRAGTIAYELVTGLTSRVPRVECAEVRQGAPGPGEHPARAAAGA